MCDEKYKNICERYYRLSKQTHTNLEEETEITEILELSLEDSYLSSLIDDIDNQLCKEADYIPSFSESDLTIDLFKIQEFIKNHIAEDCPSVVDKPPAVSILIKFVRNLVLSSSPSEVLLTFQRVFVKGEYYPLDVRASDALSQLTGIEYGEDIFSCVIHDCLYTVVNEWMIKPSHHIFIARLISLFEQQEILRSSQTQKPHITKALLDFTQTDQFIRLFRLANCIRYQIYISAEGKKTLKQVESMLGNDLAVPELKQNVITHPKAPQALQYKQRASLVTSASHSSQNVKSNKSSYKSFTVKGSDENFLDRIQAKISKLCQQATSRNTTRKQEPDERLMIGVVETPIMSSRLGSVKVNGIFWRAQLSKHSPLLCIEKGERIKVVGRCNITLIVEAYKEPKNKAITFPTPIVEIAKDPIAFGQIGKITFRGTTRNARLHEGFSYDRLHTHQKVKVVAEEDDLLVITPCSPSLNPNSSSYNSRRLKKRTVS